MTGIVIVVAHIVFNCGQLIFCLGTPRGYSRITVSGVGRGGEVCKVTFVSN